MRGVVNQRRKIARSLLPTTALHSSVSCIAQLIRCVWLKEDEVLLMKGVYSFR